MVALLSWELNMKRLIKAGFPQGSVLRPILYTYNIPTIVNNTIASFSDSSSILAVEYIGADTVMYMELWQPTLELY